MSHYTSPAFWKFYQRLPLHIQKLADENFKLLQENPRHPSLHFKKEGLHWSVRVGDHYRAVAVQSPHGVVWHWIGTHTEYDGMTRE